MGELQATSGRPRHPQFRDWLDCIYSRSAGAFNILSPCSEKKPPNKHVGTMQEWISCHDPNTDFTPSLLLGGDWLPEWLGAGMKPSYRLFVAQLKPYRHLCLVRFLGLHSGHVWSCLVARMDRLDKQSHTSSCVWGARMKEDMVTHV
jgi:hypothetical protein